MKNVYFISGLGADKRVFSFLDLSFCQPVFIDWIKPLKKESLAEYAIRLRQQINEKEPVVVGISFGGMLATEMAKAEQGLKAIILSSNKVSSEFPSYLRSGKYMPIYKLLPPLLLQRATLLLSGFLGAKSAQSKRMLDQIIRDADPHFLQWAISAILSWKNTVIPGNLIHIHGTNDKLLPYKLVKADHTIKNGTHVMPMDDHREISTLLKKLITNNS